MLFLVNGIVLSNLLGYSHRHSCCGNQQEPSIDIVTHGKETIGFRPMLAHPDVPRNDIDSPEKAADKITSSQPGSAP